MPNSLPSRPFVPLNPRPHARTYVRSRAPQAKPVRIRRRLATIAGLGLAGLVAGLLSGCSVSSLSLAGNPAGSGSDSTSWAALSGNWGFAAAAGTPVSASRLTSLGGSLAVTGSSVTATLHALSAGQCLDASELLHMTGAVTSEGSLSLSGKTTAGDTVKIAGTVAPDQQSLGNASLTASGGACAPSASSHAAIPARPRDGGTVTAQQYQPVTGTYTGTLTTADGSAFALTTTVTQLDQPDTGGTYHIEGTATAPGNACVPSAVTATASVLSGGVLSATYTDGSGTSITAAGYASADASTLVLTHWEIASGCGADSGTGILIHQ